MRKIFFLKEFEIKVSYEKHPDNIEIDKYHKFEKKSI